MDKFEQYKLDLSEKDKKIVQDYLDKLNNLTKKYNIDKELYNDIEEMLFEKLQAEENLDQLKIIKIIKEVGEPEIIFSDYIEVNEINNNKTSEKKEEYIYQKLLNNGWLRDNENAIFLGISKTLADKLQISVLLVRILLLILIFPLGISIWVYILVGLILPVKGIDYSGKSNISYFKTQIILVIKNGIYNLITSFMKLMRFIPVKILIILKSIFVFCIKNILPVFRFFIFGLIGLFLSFGLIGLITIGSLYFTNFNFENIDFVQSLPNYFIFGIIFGIISITIFTIFSFIYGFSKKIINKYILSFGLISFIIALFLGISTGFDLIQKYSNKNEFTQKTEINIGNTGSYIINLNDLKETSFDLGGAKSIKLINSTGS
ncbi:MAG: PspC domain-containing protein, partial [Candidatus Gracilibacteria bacterium]|nr:PspC domain-containing protein [Candidatus Gracilibacteria bacterium]